MGDKKPDLPGCSNQPPKNRCASNFNTWKAP